MTVQQLINWVSVAYNYYGDSYNCDTEKYEICLKQSLLKTEPTVESHGYGTSNGEREVAIVLIYTCHPDEIYTMENQTYSIGGDKSNVPSQPPTEPTHTINVSSLRRALNELSIRTNSDDLL